uniref:THUMP domain-containing protein n=1 Tax=Geobacter sp. (strain M21) TaxID=443144 RepID=C6E247_GEOSM
MGWNVVVTVQEGGYQEALKALRQFGEVGRSEYFNVLTLRVPDYRHFIEELLEEVERDPQLAHCLAGVVPVIQTFSFQTPAQFEEKARQAVCAWLPVLEGKSFHVRMHRRGFKGKLSSMEEEQRLDHYLLEALELTGSAGRISFDDPDAIIAVETVGAHAGLSLWSREDLRRYPLLHLN